MDQRIKKVLDFIEDNLGEQLDLASLSKIACMSDTHFHRIFKRETQRTPFKFIEEMRMNKAYQQITEQQVTVQQLSLHLGYKDYETFSRAYKKYFSLSPDDMKAIITKLKKTSDSELVYVFSSENEDQQELVKMINKLIEEKKIPKDDLIDSKVFTVSEKDNSISMKNIIVKNKFKLKEDKKLWELLINQIKES